MGVRREYESGDPWPAFSVSEYMPGHTLSCAIEKKDATAHDFHMSTCS